MRHSPGAALPTAASCRIVRPGARPGRQRPRSRGGRGAMLHLAAPFTPSCRRVRPWLGWFQLSCPQKWSGPHGALFTCWFDSSKSARLAAMPSVGAALLVLFCCRPVSLEKLASYMGVLLRFGAARMSRGCRRPARCA